MVAAGMSTAALVLAPPPGLDQPHRARPQDEPAYVSVPGIPRKSFEPAYVTIASQPAAAPKPAPQYQVLLCGLPEAMTHPAVIGTMMDQANLTPGIMVANKFVDDFGDSCGKVLVTFANSTWAKKCVKYFNGRWANAGLVVSALIVGIIPGNKVQESPVPVPPRTESTVPVPLSLEALLMAKADCHEHIDHGKVSRSNASTKGSAASNGTNSDDSESDSDSEAEDEMQGMPAFGRVA